MIAVIRVRGNIGVRKELRDTLELLNLTRVNHLVLVPGEKGSFNMVKKVEPYVTFGEISEETTALLLKKRGRLSGNKKLTEEFLKEKKLKSFEELAKAVLEGKASLKKLGIKKVFRLSPPSKGFERAGIKKSYSIGGAAGYRASDINALINKMV